jgi:hypothetical protein
MYSSPVDGSPDVIGEPPSVGVADEPDDVEVELQAAGGLAIVSSCTTSKN